jgi:hypothetical protein
MWLLLVNYTQRRMNSMFNFYKHDKEIALSFHIGYQTDCKVLVINISVYKYSLTIGWGDN